MRLTDSALKDRGEYHIDAMRRNLQTAKGDYALLPQLSVVGGFIGRLCVY